MFLLSGFLIGLVGSLHCIGMCGPIVIAISSVDQKPSVLILQRVLYHFGKALTYALMGAVFGLLGNHIKLSGMQQAASIGIGAVIVIWILLPVAVKSKFSNLSLVNRYNTRVKSTLSKVLRSGKTRPYFVIGLVNGFLPCGLVYAGLAGAVYLVNRYKDFLHVPVWVSAPCLHFYFSFARITEISSQIKYPQIDTGTFSGIGNNFHFEGVKSWYSFCES